MAESPFASEVSVAPRLAQGFLLVFVTDDASSWEGGNAQGEVWAVSQVL